jgi:hypothetical protein
MQSTAAAVLQVAKKEKHAKLQKRWQGAKTLGVNYLHACALRLLYARCMLRWRQKVNGKDKPKILCTRAPKLVKQGRGM